jgi:hypothetical protein
MSEASAQPLAPVALRARSPRSAVIEALRVIGCVGVVMFHVNAPWPRHVFPGSEMFMTLAVAFASMAAGKQAFARFARTRFFSLMVTWLLWWAFYAAYRSAFAIHEGNALLSWLESPHQMLSGPAVHLWFLPFAFVVAVGAGWLMMRGRGEAGDGSAGDGSAGRGGGRGWLVWGVVCAGMIVLCAFAKHRFVDPLREDGLHGPYHNWLRMLPGAALGVALAQVPLRRLASLRRTGVIAAMGLAACGIAHFSGWTDLPSRYIPTLVLLCVGWCIPLSAPAWLMWLSQLTFGVYLAHMFTKDLVQKAMLVSGFHVFGREWLHGGLTLLVTFPLAAILRYTWLRWSVGIWPEARAQREETSPASAARPSESDAGRSPNHAARRTAG